MIVWAAQHARALGRTLARMARSPFATLSTMLVFGTALALPLALHVGTRTLAGLGAQARIEPQLSVYLALEAGAAERAGIERRLAAHPGVAAARFISREEALRELRSRHGLGDIVDTLPENPLPDAWIVRPASTAPAELERLHAEISSWPRIASVQFDGQWARRLDAALRLARALTLALAALLAAALVAVTFNTIRLQILTRAEEIEVAKLIGATDAYVRRPFLYAGALQGMLGGCAALGIVASATLLANRHIEPLAALYQTHFAVAMVPLPDALALLGFAALLGWLGAWLSVTGHLRRFAPR